MSINTTKNIYNQSFSLDNVSQDVVPQESETYNLGSSTKKWNEVFASTIHYDTLDPPIIGGGGGGSSQWTTSGSTIYYNGGSVGIGTATPTYKLTTFGTSNTGISIQNASTSVELGLTSVSGGFSSDAISGDAVLRSGTGRNLMFQSGGSASSIYIKADGKVGIGTKTPVNKLDVNGTMCVGDGIAGPSGSSTLILTGASNAPSITTKPTLYHRHNVGLGIASDSDVSIQVNGISSLNEALRIKSDSKVGVGTTNPQTIFQIKDKIAFESNSTADGTNLGWNAINFNGYFNNGQQRFDPNKGIWRMVVDQRNTFDNFFIDYYSGSETITPFRLQQNGNVDLSGNVNLSNKNITGVNTLTVNQLNYTSLNPPISGGGGSSQWTTSGTSIYYNSGSVGIGITNPTSKLHVIGDTKTTSLSSTSVFPISITSAISLNNNDITGVNQLNATEIHVVNLNYTNLNPPISGAFSKIFFNRLTNIALNPPSANTRTQILFLSGTLGTDYVDLVRKDFTLDTGLNAITYTGSITKNFLVHCSFALQPSATATNIGIELVKNTTPISQGRWNTASSLNLDLQDFNCVSLSNGDSLSLFYSCSNIGSILASNSQLNLTGSTTKPLQIWITEI